MTCTYPQSIELKSRDRADATVRDVVLALAVAVIFVPFALIPLVLG